MHGQGNGRATFVVGDIPRRVAIGRMCCVVACSDLVEHELHSWPGVETVSVDEARGRVDVVLATDHPTLDQLMWSFKHVGFDDVEVVEFTDPSPVGAGGGVR